MAKTQTVPQSEAVHVSLGVQLLNYDEAEPLSNQTWAGAEEILEHVDLSGHPNSESTLRHLLERGWDSESVTGLLLGVWMKKAGSAGEVAEDLLSLSLAQRRSLTALYAASRDGNVVQYSIAPDGTLLKHMYGRKAVAPPDIKLFAG